MTDIWRGWRSGRALARRLGCVAGASYVAGMGARARRVVVEGVRDDNGLRRREPFLFSAEGE